MIVQWYPGHMNKARVMMEADIKLVDLVIEVVDARAPLSSRNPDIDKFAKQKGRVIIMNKVDLADKKVSESFRKYFDGLGYKTVFLNSKAKEGLRDVLPAVREVCADKIERNLKRGIKNQPLRAMVVGIPNVGKSTFINAFAGRNIAKTGNKPGVTKGKQWIKVSNELELMDTPGILWPKFEDREVGMKLAYLGSINDEILQIEELAGELLMFLFEHYPKELEERFKIGSDIFENVDFEEQFVTKQSVMLDKVALVRGLLKSGSTPDYFKAAGAVLDDFRNGRIGRITLEEP